MKDKIKAALTWLWRALDEGGTGHYDTFGYYPDMQEQEDKA